MSPRSTESSRSLSDRLRARFTGNAEFAAADEEQRSKIQAVVEEVDRREHSTIARAMSEGSAVARRRGAAAMHQILEYVEDHPGCDVHELARALGEKSIFVLSHVDNLVREGLLIRVENGCLYRSRDFLSTGLEEKSQEAAAGNQEEGLKALGRLEQTRIYLRVFRFLTSELGLEPECRPKMTARSGQRKFFEMKSAQDSGVHISLYGMYPKELVERFKQESEFDRRRINYSHLTGIIDIRGCRYQDLDGILPWVGVFYKASRKSESASESA